MVVINRYKDAPVSIGFIKNFGLKKGAIASSVAHDSHNIIAIGADDESLCRAVNLVIENHGGISCADVGNPSFEKILPLPVAGLMSNDDGYKVAEMYTRLDKAAKDLGSKLSAPFMTLSFMALLVIPHLKLSDLGLFDGDNFTLYNQAAAFNNMLLDISTLCRSTIKQSMSDLNSFAVFVLFQGRISIALKSLNFEIINFKL